MGLRKVKIDPIIADLVSNEVLPIFDTTVLDPLNLELCNLGDILGLDLEIEEDPEELENICFAEESLVASREAADQDLNAWELDIDRGMESVMHGATSSTPSARAAPGPAAGGPAGAARRPGRSQPMRGGRCRNYKQSDLPAVRLAAGCSSGPAATAPQARSASDRRRCRAELAATAGAASPQWLGSTAALWPGSPRLGLDCGPPGGRTYR